MENALEIFWSPERILAVVVTIFVAIVLLVRRVRKIQPPPEPWGTEVGDALAQPEATPICHRCFRPQPQLPGWFCPECGAATGPYNNSMEYLSLFSIGEVLSTGSFHRFAVSPLTVGGFLVLSLAEYNFFAPIYWFWLIRNIRRLRCQPLEPPAESPHPASADAPGSSPRGP